MAGQIKHAGEGGPCAPAVAEQKVWLAATKSECTSLHTMTNTTKLAHPQDTYIAAGDPSGERWAPAFVWHGFRYVQLSGWPSDLPVPTPAAMTGHAMFSATPSSGSFNSSWPILNRIHHLAVASHTSNMMSVQSDCPHRERFGYSRDAARGLRAGA